MIQLLFLFTSRITFHSASNQLSDADETEFANKSSSYEIFDNETGPFNDFIPRHLKDPTVANFILTNDMIQHVPIIILQRHNHIREEYNFPPLRLSAKLNYVCEMYAKKLASGDTSLMTDHLPQYGININYANRAFSHPNYIMNAWIRELDFYDPEKSDKENVNNMYHISQVLWKDTVAIGVCITEIHYLSAETFVLYILYDPPIEVAGFKKNIPLLNSINNPGTICYQESLFVILLNFYLLHQLQNCIN